jgi:hypothetical protein
MKFPTDALTGADVAPVVRDDVTVAAMPGDRFALAPASSSELGDDAWRAHLAWGAEKASAIIGGGG